MKQWGDKELTYNNIYWYADTALNSALKYARENNKPNFYCEYETYITNFLSWLRSDKVFEYCIRNIDDIINYIMEGNCISTMADLRKMIIWKNKGVTAV